MTRTQNSPRNRVAAHSAIALGLVLAAGCSLIRPLHVGSGVKVKESRPLAAFHQISVAGSADITVTPGAEHRVDIRFDDNLMQYLRTEVVGGELEIELDDDARYRFEGALEVAVVTPDFDGLSIAGSAELVGTGIDADRFELAIAGSGEVTLAGRAQSLDLSIAGSGDLHLEELSAGEVDVSIAGSGDVTVHADERLEVSIAGSGTVRYTGAPEVSHSIMGSGEVLALKP